MKRSHSKDSLDQLTAPSCKRRAYDEEDKNHVSTELQWSSCFEPSCIFAQVPGWKVLGGTRRVALFDLDKTLIATKSGNAFFIHCDDWKWFASVVPKKLRELHNDGYLIFILTNQSCPKAANRESFYRDWKVRFERVAGTSAMQGIPFRLLASVQYDYYRKPLPGMWETVLELLKEENNTPDLEHSFFVGDFAGRPADKGDSDLKFAHNIGVKLHTPDEFFLGRPVETRKPNGFHPSTTSQDEYWFQPSNTPLVPVTKARKPVIVLLVGLPAVGKTTLYRKHFEPAGYVHVSNSRTSDNITTIEEACAKGKSVVVDKVNETKCTRRDYVDCAKNLNMSVYCIWLTGNDVAWHNNVYRAVSRTETLIKLEGEASLVTDREFRDRLNRFEEPTRAEGFKDLKRVYFRFEGTEEDRKRYMLWHPGRVA